MPVARAAFFATRLSPAPVLRIVCFADFTTFVVLDFLRLAILFPPVRYLVGPSPRPLCEAVIVRSNPHHHGFGFRVWKQSRNGTGLVRLLSPVLRAVEMTGSHRHTHTAPAATQRVCAVNCSDCYRRLSGRSAAPGGGASSVAAWSFVSTQSALPTIPYNDQNQRILSGPPRSS
jgi:hypothetical protein